MKKFWKFIKSLRFIFKPTFWLRNYKTNMAVDVMINRVVDEDLVKSFDQFEAKTKNGLTIWIENYPYAYARIVDINGMPTRTTVEKFGKYIAVKQAEYLSKI